MRSRLKHKYSVIAYDNKASLKDKSFDNSFTANHINGGKPAFIKELPMAAKTPQEWVQFVCTAMSVDKTTARIMTYISYHTKAIESGLIHLTYKEVKAKWQGNPLSMDAYYSSVRALMYIQCLAPADEKTYGKSMYFINTLYFIPSGEFKVSVYYKPKSKKK
jgi:hypothetical protein